MNILFLSPNPITKICRGGIERSTERCAQEMISRGHKVTILSWGKSDPNKILDTFFQKTFPFEKPHNANANRKLFEKTLLEEKIDIVVFQCGGDWKFPFPKEIQKHKIPTICTIHSVPDSYIERYQQKYSGFARWWNTLTKRWRQIRKYRFNYNCCAQTIVVARGLIPALKNHLTKKQIEESKIDFIWNFSPIQTIEHDFQSKKKELLFVGRMSFFEKRPDFLLQVWTKLQSAFPDWSLRFVGGGEYLPKLKELAKTLDAQRVNFEGCQDPTNFYRNASIFCMTSAYESFGNVLVEAASFACVPVAFDSFAAVHDIITDGENGFIVPAFNLDAYAEKLALLMQNDSLRERLAKNASTQIPEKFSPQKIGDKWETLFHKLTPHH